MSELRCPSCWFEGAGDGHRSSCPRLLALESLASSLLVADSIFPRRRPAPGLEVVEVPSIAWEMLLTAARSGIPGFTTVGKKP